MQIILQYGLSAPYKGANCLQPECPQHISCSLNFHLDRRKWPILWRDRPSVKTWFIIFRQENVIGLVSKLKTSDQKFSQFLSININLLFVGLPTSAKEGNMGSLGVLSSLNFPETTIKFNARLRRRNKRRSRSIR